MIHRFTDIDRQSKLFNDLRTSLLAHLATMRENNDKSKPELETAELRGQIKAIKSLLADMSEPKKPARQINPY